MAFRQGVGRYDVINAGTTLQQPWQDLGRMKQAYDINSSFHKEGGAPPVKKANGNNITIMHTKGPAKGNVKKPIALDGTDICYKGKLSEYVQKSRLPFPEYSYEDSEAGIIATVKLNNVDYCGLVPLKQKKEASEHAAHCALFKLGIVSADPASAAAATSLKRSHKEAGLCEASKAPQKAAMKEKSASINSSLTYKNQLQEYCQKKQVSMPIYDTTALNCHPVAFTSTVMVNGIDPQVGEQKLKKRDAEQSAACSALKVLGIVN